MKKKIIVAIADGLGDRPNRELGNLTPLQYATTPHLDFLAAKGSTGLMDPIAPGITVGTDMGHIVLFGHDSTKYPGRGPIEAAGVGLDLIEGDIAFRCNFATYDGSVIIDRRAGRIRKGTEDLAKALNNMQIDDVVFKFKEATEHRAVLVMRGEGLSAQVSDSDPKAPNDGKPYNEVYPLDDTPEAKKTADILNKFLQKAYCQLKYHPVNIDRVAQGNLAANFIITRGAGRMTQIPHLGDELGFSCSVIAGEDTVLGVARLSGYTAIQHKNFTGNVDTDVALKAKLALRELETNDIVFVHMKATDVKGHDNDPKGKAVAIEKFDEMVGYILPHLPQDAIVALCADHSTPCEKGEHSGEPVPVVMSGAGILADSVQTYDEEACGKGRLNRLTGHQFIWSLLDYLEVVPKQGN
ncbi:2,3-bisphosphoglycerate-independent phosphoglycerate mutase [Candidatus Enterococcus willemsii]|nr:2,3-bisphosphoglycerate-independent phosphoglycerate mutase [Enterococcus sp. CU12B]